MAGSSRFEIDGVLNASGIAKGAQDGKKALADLEEAVGDVADESAKAGGKVDTFASRIVDAARKAGKADDDIKDALRDMGLSARQAEEAVEGVGDEFKDTGREGDRAADKLEDSLKDVQQQSDRTSDGVGKIREGFRRAEEGAEEFKNEANSTAREAAASFDGSAESIADAFQEVAANAFAGFGPAGAVAGLVAAAGIGLVISAIENVGEASEESRQRAAEWAQAYVEAGGKVLTTAITTAKVMDIATDPDKYTKATQNAKNWGVDVSTAINAMAGETWALNAVNDSLVTSAEKVNDEMSKTGEQYDWTGESMTDLVTRTANGQRAFDELTGEMQRGSEQADALSASLRNTAENTEGAATVVDEFGDKVTKLPDGTTIYVDAETGQATTDLDFIERKAYGVPDAELRAYVSGVNQVRVDLDALTKPRTVTIQPRVLAAVGATRSWDE